MKVISGERRGALKRKSGVDKWRKGASDGTMHFKIAFICIGIFVCYIVSVPRYHAETRFIARHMCTVYFLDRVYKQTRYKHSLD